MLLDNPLTIDDFPHEAQCIGAPPCIYYGNLFENPTFYIRMIIFAYNSKIPGYNQIYSIYYSSHPYTCLYIYIYIILSPYIPNHIYIYIYVHPYASIFSHHFPSVFVAGFFQATIHIGARWCLRRHRAAADHAHPPGSAVTVVAAKPPWSGNSYGL